MRGFMKKLTLALAVAALSLSTSAFAADAAHAQGEIKFTGMVTTAGCTVVPNDSNSSINLGSVPVAKLQNKGTSPWVTGEIKFEGCAAEGESELNTVSLTVNHGLAVKENSTLWLNEGSAQNVGVNVQISGDEGFTAVLPDGSSAPIKAAIKGETAIYKVQGQMVGTGVVGAGTVATTLRFTAEYN